ncbi:hypothetical protein NUW58_g3607 [Xylaria curta]|uniref:Uncharacterized protein n=1 Tax=Xylaria curta TaxID=42375 RepID=A0ACC1PA66_9PEZI|nr:hypothetical protein NUW58_g3607 [Xylaria curta]
MHANILTILAAPLLFVAGAQGYVSMYLYQDNDCKTLIPGTGMTTVNSGSCDTNVRTGWSSAKIISNQDSPAGTLTFYTNNNCAAGQQSHGYSSGNFACLNNFGFVANAVGLAG